MTNRLDRAGQQIGNYRLLRWLGGGGFGDVYLAQQVQDQTQVAIKLLHIRLSQSEDLKAFINEARTIRLHHPHIVPLLDFGISQQDIPYLVMEYATQGTLRDRHPKGSQVPLQRLSGHHGWVLSVEWSPDGQWLVSGSNGEGSGELFVWDVSSVGAESGASPDSTSPSPLRTFVGHPSVVYAVAWSPDGSQLISGGGDGVLRWWDVETAECVYIQEAHHGMIRSLKVSPDGKFLVSCGDDAAIRIWDMESHEYVQTLRRDRPYERLNIAGIRGLNDAQKA